MEEIVKNVYLGSTNRCKIQATRDILEPLGYQVVGKKVDSNVSNQPTTDEETIKGAISRALNLKEGYLRIGLEGGVTKQGGIFYLINWGAMVDEEENIYIAGGTRIPLPQEIEHYIMDEHLELSEAMEKYYNEKSINTTVGAIGYFTSDFVVREEVFTHIVKLLYGQYLYFKKTGEKK